MIQIEFIKSPDQDIINCRYERMQPKVTVGNNANNNIIIADPEIKGSALTLSTDQDGIWIENSNKNNYYFSNQKKTTGRKLHHIDDEITVGQTTFKIVHYQHTPHYDRVTEFKMLKDEQERKNPSLKILLEKLKNELKNITFKQPDHGQ